jgi:hypothetical protein
MEPYTPTSKSIDRDPDAVYAAAIRVFLRRGWGFQSRDPAARAVETGWFPYSQIHLAAKKKLRASFRVIVSRGLIEVFTSCGVMSGSTIANSESVCSSERPEGINVREQELVADILQEVQRQGLPEAPAAVAPAAPAAPAVIVVAPAAAAPPAPPPAASGPKCATSSECSGDLVCLDHHCQLPPGQAQKCATSSECTGELVCISSRCVAPPPAGAR